jgi:hypothetical protein
MALVSDSEMAALRGLAESGMVTEVTILVRATVVTDDGQENVWATGDTVNGWLYEVTPMGTALGAIAGAVGITETFSLRVPVGTAVNSGDHVAIGSTIYTVQHTNADNTYSPWVVMSVKVVE